MLLAEGKRVTQVYGTDTASELLSAAR